MIIKHGAHRLAVPALLALALALAVAACGAGSGTGVASGAGSSSHAATTTAAARFSARRAKLRACLQQHGVSLPARPRGFAPGGPPPAGAPGTGAGAGTTRTTPRPHLFGGGGGLLRANPKLRAALRACGGDFPRRFGAGPGLRPHFSAATLAAFTACVKKHGYTLPKPNASGHGPIFPRSVQSSAAFQRAAAPCAILLRPAFRRPPGPPPGATTTTTPSTA